ncbi:MAG: tetratricopeptide repeat protein [Endomicrobia bacterium]|nr:tetratricopeptide repeat protein [Endomicrobiia bacterium]MCX7940283.1 tetratricopeptide repeat protein [Endomicrobiia bacterium]MDW8055813.1 tetratricopeptide repeat protein [Elusimicrobiota bacterium]
MISIFIGIIFIVVGLLYIYKISLLIKICESIKKFLFNERIIILHGKKIGLFLILTGIVSIGVEIRKAVNRDLTYVAYKNYYSRNFTTAEKLCFEILNKQPKNSEVLMLLGKVYFAAGKYRQARIFFHKVLSIDESKRKEVERYLSMIDIRFGGLKE